MKNCLFRSCMQEIDESEKERIFCGHGIEHLLSVARIMRINALEENNDIDKEIIYAAALLHDIGRARAYRLHTDHAAESAEIASRILEECDFDKAETDEIIYAVLHHNDSEKSSELCSLLRNADRLSRNCFACKAYEECNWSENKKNQGVSV
ncbi:HD domain-containing protein [Ruminococcus sp.]|uniref:HD domain-containing protein n=1 Tax=Ruminococcus sp. TaxID=41978 RepID=UPI003EFDC32C